MATRATTVQITMPQMGESIAEGTMSRWLKKVGDEVKRDEPIFEISTDKVDAEIPAPNAGVLAEILVQEGETLVLRWDGKLYRGLDTEAIIGRCAAVPDAILSTGQKSQQSADLFRKGMVPGVARAVKPPDFAG